jgi:hypothetical protein
MNEKGKERRRKEGTRAVKATQGQTRRPRRRGLDGKKQAQGTIILTDGRKYAPNNLSGPFDYASNQGP